MCGKHFENGIDLGNERRKKRRREGVEEEGKGREGKKMVDLRMRVKVKGKVDLGI